MIESYIKIIENILLYLGFSPEHVELHVEWSCFFIVCMLVCIVPASIVIVTKKEWLKYFAFFAVIIIVPEILIFIVGYYLVKYLVFCFKEFVNYWINLKDE